MKHAATAYDAGREDYGGRSEIFAIEKSFW